MRPLLYPLFTIIAICILQLTPFRTSTTIGLCIVAGLLGLSFVFYKIEEREQMGIIDKFKPSKKVEKPSTESFADNKALVELSQKNPEEDGPVIIGLSQAQYEDMKRYKAYTIASLMNSEAIVVKQEEHKEKKLVAQIYPREIIIKTHEINDEQAVTFYDEILSVIKKRENLIMSIETVSRATTIFLPARR